jgi:uncharacterized protein
MDEVQLRTLQERHQYLTELGDRKATILKSIADQGQLTDKLRAAIAACTQKTDLEDLYLPYRPKRRTRATVAKENGLEPLATAIAAANQPQAQPFNLSESAQVYCNDTVPTVEDALQGAADILAEAVAERADLRAWVRGYLLESGRFQSRIDAKVPEGSTQYELYRRYETPVRKIAPHNLLALLRGQREKVLSLELAFDTAAVLHHLEAQVIRTRQPELRRFYQTLIQDAFNRLMKTSLVNGVIAEKKAWADEASIQTFESNLRDLLLAPPAGMKTTLALDPGFRTGCKVAVIDPTGQFLHYEAVFPHQGAGQRQKAATTLAHLIQTHGVDLIAIGNGTASRETDAFVAEVLQTLPQKPVKVMVNEAGASVYSASEVAIAEFPDPRRDGAGGDQHWSSPARSPGGAGENRPQVHRRRPVPARRGPKAPEAKAGGDGGKLRQLCGGGPQHRLRCPAHLCLGHYPRDRQQYRRLPQSNGRFSRS